MTEDAVLSKENLRICANELETYRRMAQVNSGTARALGLNLTLTLNTAQSTKQVPGSEKQSEQETFHKAIIAKPRKRAPTAEDVAARARIAEAEAAENYLVWESMSNEYKKANPWTGRKYETAVSELTDYAEGLAGSLSGGLGLQSRSLDCLSTERTLHLVRFQNDCRPNGLQNLVGHKA